MKKTTLCYIENNGSWLMLYRNRKPDDPNVSRLLLKHHMVLLGGNGALVMGPNEEEAEARAQILIKGAYTALYQNAVGGDFRVSYLDASLQKIFYERKYSKLKE